MPLITIVRTSLLDEMECEGFIEIVDEFLSMTEVVLEAPSITHVLRIGSVVAEWRNKTPSNSPFSRGG